MVHGLLNHFVWIMMLEYMNNNRQKLKYFFIHIKFMSYDEVGEFNPDMLINAVTLNNTKMFLKKFNLT